MVGTVTTTITILVGSTVGSAARHGLSTAIMLFCIGTLSILGPINSTLYGEQRRKLDES